MDKKIDEAVEAKIEEIELEDLRKIAATEEEYSNFDNESEKSFLNKPTTATETSEASPTAVGITLTENDELEMQPLNAASADVTADTSGTPAAPTDQIVQRGLSYLNSNFGSSHRKPLLIGLAVLVLLFGIGATLKYCLITVQYDQLALSRNVITGRLHADNTYQLGLHFIMPWNELLYFQRSAHSMSFKRLKILTRDKLEVVLSVDVYYFLNPKQLGALYRKFADGYKPVIEKVARSALLNIGQQFTIKDYREERLKVYRRLQTDIKALFTSYNLDLLNIYVAGINFDKEINNLNLIRVLNEIYNEKALYTKKIVLTVAETGLQVNSYRNKARTVLSNATIISNKIFKASSIDCDFQIENIHVQRLNSSLNDLKFTNPFNKTVLKQRLSYIYLYSLINHKNLNIFSRENSYFKKF